MAKGKFSDTNLALLGSFTPGVGDWTLPLSNLLDEGDYIGSPARCTTPADLASSRFELVLPEPRLVSFLALFFHTMTLSARCRITAAGPEDPTYTAPVLETGWFDVYPSIYDPADLEWGVENWWTGTVTQAEIDLYPRHMWKPFPETLAERFLVELDDANHPDGWFDVGGLYLASGFSPEINYDRGRDLQVIPRDLVDQGPSGRNFSETRTPQRQLTISFSNLTDAEARRWIDAAMRARTTQTVVFVPDADDPAALIREAFPATFERPPGSRFVRGYQNAATPVFKEILA